MPASDADPQASAATSYPGDATFVTARSDSADGGTAGTVFGVGANCNKWDDAKAQHGDIHSTSRLLVK